MVAAVVSRRPSSSWLLVALRRLHDEDCDFRKKSSQTGVNRVSIGQRQSSVHRVSIAFPSHDLISTRTCPSRRHFSSIERPSARVHRVSIRVKPRIPVIFDAFVSVLVSSCLFSSVLVRYCSSSSLSFFSSLSFLLPLLPILPPAPPSHSCHIVL